MDWVEVARKHSFEGVDRMNAKMGEGSWWSRAGVDPFRFVGRDESASETSARSGFLAKARRHLGQIPMAREAVAMYFCLLDPKTPRWVKGIVAAALAYFVLPIDAIPDFLPLIGLSDDMSILAAAYASVSNFVTDEHRTKAAAWIGAGADVVV